MSEIFYATFFSIGSLIILLIGIVFFTFTFFLKEKSKQTFHFAISLLCLSCFHLFYLIAATTYHPLGAFHRVGTVIFALMGAPHICYLFISYQAKYYPEVKKIGRILFYIFYAILIYVVFIFLIHVLSVDKLYYFSGHYWDFDADSISKQIGILIVIYYLISISISMWSVYRVYKRIKKIEYSYILVSFLFLLVTIPSGILNILSRDGLILRATFQMMTVTTSVIGMFFLITLYLNISNEKTKIIHRIIAVTFSTFLFLIQFLSQNIIAKKEISYNTLKQNEMKLYITSKKKSSDLKYFGYFDFEKNQYYPMFTTKENSQAFSENEVIEWKNSKMWYLLSQLNKENVQEFSSAFKKLMNKAHIEFLPYKRTLLNIFNQNKHAINTQKMLEILDSYKLRINYIRKQLEKIPKINFYKEKLPFLEVKDKNLIPFVKTIKSLIRSQQHKKLKVLLYLRPFVSPKERKYRGKIRYKKGESIPEHFTSFNYMNTDSDRLYEAGFSYLEYRRNINLISSDFILSIFLFLLFVLFAFPLFFSNILINPIRTLATGFKEINTGNLNYQINVQVEDEIGFLTRSFNKMGRSLKSAHQQLQKHAESLEEKVKNRTEELNNTLTKVTKLKDQQDGDYFLTHLLTQSLSKNQVNSKKIKVDFLIRQRKRFSFRNYISKDIGGDLNISQHITLNQKKYIAFLNADGMGKSMQGAAGALICGSVFKSIIDRTQNIESFEEQDPQQWLKTTFIELHHIFKSFLGNMLVSCILGLIEENTGIGYYINAGHPRMILYRQGKANFINKHEDILSKLGTLDSQENIHIRIFEMQHNDIIFIGSDGKDELVVGVSGNGRRIINEDEDLFLHLLEKSDGNLKQIFKLICDHGHIIDDISLIRIQYTNNKNILKKLSFS